MSCFFEHANAAWVVSVTLQTFVSVATSVAKVAVAPYNTCTFLGVEMGMCWILDVCSLGVSEETVKAVVK